MFSQYCSDFVKYWRQIKFLNYWGKFEKRDCLALDRASKTNKSSSYRENEIHILQTFGPTKAGNYHQPIGSLLRMRLLLTTLFLWLLSMCVFTSGKLRQQIKIFNLKKNIEKKMSLKYLYSAEKMYPNKYEQVTVFFFRACWRWK